MRTWALVDARASRPPPSLVEPFELLVTKLCRPMGFAIEAHPDGIILMDQQGGIGLEPGHILSRARRKYVVTELPRPIVDVRRVGSLWAFNPWHEGALGVRWRCVRVDDDPRVILDLHARRGGAPPVDDQVLETGDVGDVRFAIRPCQQGPSLEHILEESRRQKAGVEAALAAALVAPLLAAARTRPVPRPDADGIPMTPWVSRMETVATWDGRVVVPHAVTRLEPVQASLGRVVSTFSELVGEEPPWLDAPSADGILQDMPAPAPPSRVAELVRALFPEPWTLEQAVREEAGLLAG